VASAVLSNAYTRICFRLGDADAKKLADGFSAFDAADLQNLSVGRAVGRIERNEYDFNLSTFLEPEVDELTARHRRDQAISLSRARYGGRKEPVAPTVSRDARTERAAASLPEGSAPIRKPAQQPAPDASAKVRAASAVADTAPLGRGGPQHQYLQQLIKRLAEDKGFRVTIEQPVLGGLGSIDVALERSGVKIACEISVSSTDVYEVGNIQKCLAAGYDSVLMVSPDRRTLQKISKRVSAMLDEETAAAVRFVLPEDLISLLDQPEEETPHEETVRGYRVKVQYKAIGPGEEAGRKQAISQVILRAMRRMKKPDA